MYITWSFQHNVRQFHFSLVRICDALLYNWVTYTNGDSQWRMIFVIVMSSKGGSNGAGAGDASEGGAKWARCHTWFSDGHYCSDLLCLNKWSWYFQWCDKLAIGYSKKKSSFPALSLLWVATCSQNFSFYKMSMIIKLSCDSQDSLMITNFIRTEIFTFLMGGTCTFCRGVHAHFR